MEGTSYRELVKPAEEFSDVLHHRAVHPCLPSNVSSRSQSAHILKSNASQAPAHRDRGSGIRFTDEDLSAQGLRVHHRRAPPQQPPTAIPPGHSVAVSEESEQ